MSRYRSLAIIFFYFCLSLVIVGHMPQTLMTHFIGSDTGDTYEMARHVWWFTYALQNGEPLFYQTWLGYPEGINGLIFISVPLQYFPMWALAFVFPLQVAYNLTVLMWMALNGWSMYFLVRSRLHAEQGATVAGIVAGVVYMAFPLFQGHLAEGHGGLMVAWGAPLYLWALFRYTEAHAQVWRWLLACVLFFYISTTGHILQAIYVLMPITGAFLLGKLWQKDWQSVRRVLIMGVLSAGILGIALLPAILEATSEASYTSSGGFVRYSADLLAVVSPSFLHPIFGDWLAYPRAVLGTNLGEGLAYLGSLSTLLALTALITQKQARWWAVLAGIAWILSLGPVLKVFDQPFTVNGMTIPLPFALLQALPGFSLARTPARFNFTLAIALAVLVGYGVAWLWQRRTGSWRYGLVGILIIGIVWEYQSFNGQPLRSANIPDAVQALQADDSVRAVFNIPYQHALGAKDALFLQTGHQRPLIAGQLTRTTPVNPAMLAMLQGTLDPYLLSQAGADVVILHRQRADEIGELATLSELANEQLGVPSYQDEQIAIYRVTPPSNAPSSTLDYAYERPLITLSGDMTLIGEAVYQWDERIYVWLQWQFASTRPDTDVRFVHVVNADGEIIAQEDTAPGILLEGDVRTELIVFDARMLTDGSYTIRTGWYDFTTLTNYSTTDGAETVELDVITLEQE